jgi:hypothetical protein
MLEIMTAQANVEIVGRSAATDDDDLACLVRRDQERRAQAPEDWRSVQSVFVRDTTRLDRGRCASVRHAVDGQIHD